jgi:catechol 2,3-dioxygenase-like lactoylglutathione lyase family enzyme
VGAKPRMTFTAVVLDAPDPEALGEFWSRLLGWPAAVHDETFVTVRPPGGATGLSIQLEENYVPPVWPARDGAQQMQLHLDIQVDDLQAGVGHALAAGARLADFQPQEDVRVFLDPVGHPFCFWVTT